MIDARRLWLAVLMQACIDLGSANECAVSERPRLRYFAQLWFVSDNYEPGSFRWICDHLDLDTSWLRRRLFAVVDAAPVSRPQFWHGKNAPGAHLPAKELKTASTMAPGLTISP
jgi:hypothetical protein